MRAIQGDHIVVRGRHVGDVARQAEVLEVRGPDGTPPYLVRWSDGHEGLFFPSSDATIDLTQTPPTISKGAAAKTEKASAKRKAKRAKPASKSKSVTGQVVDAVKEAAALRSNLTGHETFDILGVTGNR